MGRALLEEYWIYDPVQERKQIGVTSVQVPQCSHWVRGGIVLLVVLVLAVVVLLVPELGSERISGRIP